MPPPPLDTSAQPPLPPPSLLTQLPAMGYKRLEPLLERVHLDLKQVLYQPGERIAYVYFPIDALVSILTVLNDGGGIETGIVGHSGMVGLAVFLRTVTADHRAVCQVAGDAWRLPSETFLTVVHQESAFPDLLLPYTQGVLRETRQIAACNSAHPVEERCARWLLAVADLVGTHRFPMTQQFLAEMLGVRRASVGLVMSTLERAGAIRSGYGTVTVVNRTVLEGATCECYAAPRYLAVIGS